VSSESNALSFLNLYLEPFLPRKNLDLLKLSLIKKARKKKAEDPGLSEIGLIRDIVSILHKRRKTILAHLNPQEVREAAFLELLKLPPEDALLICSSTLYPIPLSSISLALKIPESSLLHRKEQLEAQFKEHHLELAPLIPETDSERERSRLIRNRRKSPLSTFQALPLGVRFLIETLLVLTLLLGLLWVIPEVRNRYESSIQTRINEYLIESALVDSPAPEGTSKDPKEPILMDQAGSQEETITKSSSDAPSQKRQPKVNAGETWRFSFTGSATPEIEASILEVLRKLHLEGQKPLNVPGGIQFDFILEVDRLLDLKNQLESTITEIQRKARAAQTSAIAYANMSWYKKRNMGTRKIPAGHVQVIVWISTL